MAVVMTVAPQEYLMIMVTEQMAKGTGLTLNDIESAKSKQWRSIYGERTNQDMDGNEDCNSELGLTGQLNGTCHHCRQ